MPTFNLINNLLVGPGTVLNSGGVLLSNLQTDEPEFVEKAAYNYRLLNSSPAIDYGDDPGIENGFDLTPRYEYLHPSNKTTRPEYGALDAGAFEFEGNPLHVELSTLKAVSTHAGIEISWITESESQSLGFILLKSLDRGNTYERLNDDLIKAAGTTLQRQSYLFQDEQVEKGRTYYYLLQQVDIDGSTVEYGPISATADFGSSVSPNSLLLHKNFPNPFNAETKIRFDVPSEGFVKIEIFDITGNRIKMLINRFVSAGQHAVRWDGTNDRGEVQSNGAYLYRLSLGGQLLSRKMMMIK